MSWHGGDDRYDDDKFDYKGDRYDDDKGGRKGKDRYDDDRGKGRWGKDRYDDDEDKGGKGSRKGKDRYDDDDKGGKGGRKGKDRYDDDDDKGGKSGRKGRDRYDDDDKGGKGGRKGRDRYDDDDKGGKGGRKGRDRYDDDDDKGGKGGRKGRDRYDDDDDKGGKGGRKGKDRYDDDDDKGGKGGRKGKDWYDEEKGKGRWGKDRYDDDKGGKGGRKGKDWYDEDKGKGGSKGKNQYDDDKGKGGRRGKGGRSRSRSQRGKGRGRSRSRSYDDKGKGARRSRSHSYKGKGGRRSRSRSYKGKGGRRSRSRSPGGKGDRWRRSRSRDGKGDRGGKDGYDKGKGKSKGGKKGKKSKDGDDEHMSEGKGHAGLKWSVGCWRDDNWDKDKFESKGGKPEEKKAPCEYEETKDPEMAMGPKGMGKGGQKKTIEEIFVLLEQEVADKVRLIQGEEGHNSPYFDAYVLNRLLDFPAYEALVLLGNFQNALEQKELRKPKAFLNRMITEKWGMTEIEFDETSTRKEVNALIRDVKALEFGNLDPNVMRTINSIDPPTAVAALKQLLETRNLDNITNLSGYTMKLIRRVQLKQAEKATIETVFEKVEAMKKKGVIPPEDPFDRRTISYLESADPKLSMDTLNELEANWTLGKTCRSINARLVALLASRERALGRKNAYESFRQQRSDRHPDTWEEDGENVIMEDAEAAAKRHRDVDFSDLSAAPEEWGASSDYKSPPRAIRRYR